MDKKKLKKMALMGITGGVMLLQPQVEAGPIPGYPTTASGCGSASSNAGNSVGYYGGDYGYEQNGFTTFQGCSGSGSPTQGFTVNQGCSGGTSSQGFTVSQGCGGGAPSQGYTTGQGCGGAAPSQSYPVSQGGCGGAAPTQGYPTGQGCGGAAPSSTTQPWQGGHGCGGSGGSTTYYSNPNTFSNQPGGQTYRSTQTPSSESNVQMPQQMMPQGTQTQQKSSYNYSSSNSRWYTAHNDEQRGGSHTASQLTEDELVSKLNDQGKAMFRSLSPEGKALALKLASQSCKGQNECKGLNSCKTDKNSCAGNGGCAGKSACSFKDKNTAVKVAAKKMAEKRALLNN